jgi:hypothetical protein
VVSICRCAIKVMMSTNYVLKNSLILMTGEINICC